MNKHIEVLNTLKSNKEMIKYCKANLQLLGSGSSRLVFALNDKLVIKVAKGTIGVKQNSTELKVWAMIDYTFEYYKRSFAKLYINMCHWMDFFVVMERVDTKNNPYKRKFNFNTRRSFDTSRKEMDPKIRQIYTHVSVIDDVTFTLNLPDLCARNVGVNNRGVLKVCDYGFDKAAYKLMCNGVKQVQTLYVKD